MRGARRPAKEAAVAMLLSFPNKRGVGMSYGRLFELLSMVRGTIFLWAGSKNVVHLILRVWIFAREMSPPQPSRIIRYPVPPGPAEEFAANHGWLLFHDKVKTTQVYLHDTTLVGNLHCLAQCNHIALNSSILRVAAFWRSTDWLWLVGVSLWLVGVSTRRVSSHFFL